MDNTNPGSGSGLHRAIRVPVRVLKARVIAGIAELESTLAGLRHRISVHREEIRDQAARASKILADARALDLRLQRLEADRKRGD